MAKQLVKNYKWVNLLLFSISAALSQALWLNFGPLISEIEAKYGVTENTAGLLLMVFPLIYVLISIPAGNFIDIKGFKSGLVLGTFIMTIGAILRIFDFSFPCLLAGQVIIALSQPFIINSISKLVLDWFEKDQEAIATGLGTMGMFIGMSVGLMITPLMVQKAGFRDTMIFFALLSTVSFVSSYYFLRPSKSLTPLREGDGGSFGFSGIKDLIKDVNLDVILILAFLGLGFFNGLTTWLEPILAPHGISSIQAGMIGGFLIIGGILGAVIMPALSDLFKLRKPFVFFGLLSAALTLFPLCTSGSYKALVLLSFFQGFFFLPAFSLILQMCSEQVGEKRAATATGLLMLLGNAGGVIVIILMEAVKSETKGFLPSVYLEFGVLLMSLVLSLALKETHPARQ